MPTPKAPIKSGYGMRTEARDAPGGRDAVAPHVQVELWRDGRMVDPATQIVLIAGAG